MKLGLLKTLALSFLLISMFGIGSCKKDKTGNTPKAQTTDSKDPRVLVNKHLKDMQIKLRLQEQKAELEAKKGYQPLHSNTKTPERSDREKSHGIVQDQEPSQKAVRKVLVDEGVPEAISPGKLVREDVSSAHEGRIQDQKTKEEYIRRFKENALRSGKKIHLNKNLDVIRVEEKK